MTSIDTFHRKLRLSFYHDTPTVYSTTIPPIDNRVPWNPPPHPTDRLLTQYITTLKSAATTHIQNSKSFFSPEDNLLHTTIQHLKKQTSIIFKPADKNLGLVLLNTPDYKDMCLQHLNDTDTYKVITDYNPDDVYNKLLRILRDHNKLYAQQNKKQYSTIAKSLLQLHKSDTPSRLAVFYAIPKVHKTLIPPIPGRPIVSSNGTPTFHASVYLDKELQPILKLLPTVCTSSRHLIKEMHNKTFPPNSVILCADVTALYPNIPITLGLSLVQKVIKRLNFFTDDKLYFLMALLRWVLTNNYCTFNNTTYLQLKGTAMGTPTAVVYSNIFLYGIEYEKLHTYTPHYYTRYIDDVFAIFPSADLASNYVNDFNSYCPTIKFEAVTVGHSGVMLDLEFTLQLQESSALDIVIHKLYQKPRNVYQYIPPSSEHKPSLFKNIILQELKRYSIASSLPSDYTSIVSSFRQRLLARGYDASTIDSTLLEVPTRSTLLTQLLSNTQKEKSTIYKKTPPIITLCIPRLNPPIPWGAICQIPETISSHPSFTNNYSTNRTVIGSRNPPSIGSSLLRSSYKDPE